MHHIAKRLFDLSKDDLIEVLQIFRIIGRSVLDEENYANESDRCIVLDALDDGEKNLRFSVPNEHFVDAIADWDKIFEEANVIFTVDEQVNGQILVASSYFLAQFEGMFLIESSHQNDEIELHGTQHVQRLLG